MLALAPKPKSAHAPDARSAADRPPAERRPPDYSRALAFRAVPRVVQAKRGAATRHADEASHAAGPGALPLSLRSQMESALGADLSGVRVHPGSPRARMLGAQAFAQGDEVHVAPGYWQPETPRGRELIGHELAHVLQQRDGRVAPTSSVAGATLNDDAGLEREADVLGARAAGGVAAIPTMASAATSSRASAPPGGVVQRRPGDFHAPLLDAFSADMGVPREEANAHGPAYNAWILIRPHQSLPTDQLLDRLAAMEADGSLAGLAADAHLLPLVRYRRERTAITVVREMRSAAGGGAAAANAAITAAAAAGLSADDQAAMGHFVRLPFTRGPDQRRGVAGAPAATGVPDAELQREIGYELDPSSRPAAAPPGGPPPARTPWDGRTGAPGEAAARAAMQSELFDAYDAYLTAFRPTVTRILAPGGSRVPVTAGGAGGGGGAAAPPPTGSVDIANQARDVLEARYGVSMNAGASTPGQAYSRSPRVTTPAADQNFFDPYDPAQRATLRGQPVAALAQGVAWWLFQNDVPGAANPAGTRDFATDVLARHHWSTQDAGAVQFRTDVARAYAAASTLAPSNARQLLDYRLAQWNERGPRGITLLSSFEPGADAARAERQQRWDMFKTAVHETLHLCTHPVFSTAAQGRGTMVEGFTEMFTISTLNPAATGILPQVRAGSREPLRRVVEGSVFTAAPEAAVITNATTPTQYRAHRAAAERIRDGGTPVAGGPSHAGVGETGVRAAYFQGHVEYLGLTPTGAGLATPPAAGAPRQLRIPGGIWSVDELAWRSGVPRATLMADNPGLTAPLPATAVLAGCREHVVVTATTTHPVTGVRTSTPETRANIAAQHGVSEADLARANPDLPLDPATSGWAPLIAGQTILIPAH